MLFGYDFNKETNTINSKNSFSNIQASLCAHHLFVIVFECNWPNKLRVSIKAPLFGRVFANVSKFN